MTDVTNNTLASFKNTNGYVSIKQLANVFVVTFEPKYGETEVVTNNELKNAEVDYGYYQHYLTV